MQKEEHGQKRAEFEATIAELPDDEKASKLAEWDTANPFEDKSNEDQDFRGKLNATNRFLKKEGYEFDEAKGEWIKKPAPKPPEKTDYQLTPMDAVALGKSDVHDEDYSLVTKWAQQNGMSVIDALKDDDLKVILDSHAEKRRTAEIANTGGPRGGKTATGSELLAKAESTGEVPDTDEGMTALAAARLEKLKGGKKR